MTALLACCLALAAGPNLPAWEFDDSAKWAPAYNVRNLTAEKGRLTFSIPKGIGYIASDTVDFPTTPYQYLEIRLKANRPGEGNLMWAGDKVPYCSWDRRAPFQARKSGWQTIVVFPFWHTDTRVKQLRLDFFGPAQFEIDYIRVKSFDAGAAAQTDNYSWNLPKGIEQWRVSPDSNRFFAPPLTLNLAEKRFVTVRLRSSTDCDCAVLFNHRDIPGLRAQTFRVIADTKARSYNVRLAGIPIGR